MVVPFVEARDSTASKAKRVADAAGSVQDDLGLECHEGTMTRFYRFMPNKELLRHFKGGGGAKRQRTIGHLAETLALSFSAANASSSAALRYVACVFLDCLCVAMSSEVHVCQPIILKLLGNRVRKKQTDHEEADRGVGQQHQLCVHAARR